MSTAKSLSHEARLLAQLLRSGRVVLLLGEPRADRTGLIVNGLAPLLARRAGDHGALDKSAPGAPGTHVPERRQPLARHLECKIVFDRWTTGVGGPLPHLRHSLAASLGVGTSELEAAPQRLDEALAVWTQNRPVRVLLLLDRFEDHLLAPHPGSSHAQVTDELVRLLNRPGLPISLLLSLSEAAEPQLLALRNLVPGLEDMSLRIKASSSAQAERESMSLAWPEDPTAPRSAGWATLQPSSSAGMASASADADPDAKAERNEPKRAPLEKPAICSDDVYALINSTLSRVATGSSANPMLETRPETSEPEIEAFETKPTAHGANGMQVAETATFDLAVQPAAASSTAAGTGKGIGWWQQLLRLLGRRT